MPRRLPKTVAEYIRMAPRLAQPHLRTLRATLKAVAPEASEVIKWGVPFLVEPRFLFSYSAFKSYCVLAPTASALEAFREELAGHETTKNFLKMPYDKPVPVALVRRIAAYRVRNMGAGDSFW